MTAMTKVRRKKFAKYTTCFGKLDIRDLRKVAEKHGMLVIRGFKPNFCCWNSIALYGTSEQMAAVETEWKAAGHDTESRKPKGAWTVSVNGPRDEWASIEIQAAKKNRISTKGATERVYLSCEGKKVLIPYGYRLLTHREKPKQSDIAWNYGAEQWEPIDWACALETGIDEFKKRSLGLARKDGKQNGK